VSKLQRVLSLPMQRIVAAWRCVRSLECLLAFLGRIYLVRVPLLTALGIVGFCVAAFFTDARLLLGNVFDIGSFWGIFFAAWTAFLSASVVMVTWRVIRLYEADRFFNYGPERRLDDPLQTSPNVSWGHLLLYGTLIGLPVVVGAIYKSETLSTARELLAALLGLVVCLLCLAVADGRRRWLTRGDLVACPPDDAHTIYDVARTSPAMFFPPGVEPVDRLLHRLSRRDPTRTLRQTATALPRHLPESWRRRVTNSLRRFLRGVGRGYYAEYDRNGRVALILPGHVAALVLLVLTFVLYVAVGIVKYHRFGEPPLFPTLSYILLLAMLLCWALSGAAFFLDRYRIPVLIPLVLWLSLSAFSPWSEYYYPVIYPEQEDESSSSNTTGRIGEGSNGKMIVVAANGGGIQSAAWTAQVLTGLERECREACDGSFDQSVHLISSVSGGSIGTMYFLNEYEGGKLAGTDEELEEIVTRAEGSSLDEIAWGVLYPDLTRTFFPNPLVWDEWDRGRALEEAWLHNDKSWEKREGIQQGLSTWRQDADDRNRPAVIFNTAVVETGLRLPLATTELPENSPGELSYDQYFSNVDPKPDIPIVTAARLSASFPYVSPAARAAVEGKTGHLVDGGYYDNYGISSLVEWLDEELEKNSTPGGKQENDSRITDVLILEIRGAPSGPGDSRTDDARCATEPETPPALTSQRSWFSQILAPPLAILSVRPTGQRTHNDVELDLLQGKWERNGVEIRRAVFEFDGADPPLSWHLTNEQKRKIQTEWAEELNDPRDACAGWDRVQEFLSSEGEG
jgi:hypothetical protein